MIVSMWMTREVVTIAPEQTILEAARLMTHRHIRRLLVVKDRPGNDSLAGIVSATDILRACGPDVNPFAVEAPDTPQTSRAISAIMTPGVISTTPETPLEEAAELMRDRKIGALPVLRESTLAGMITESDIFRAFVSLFATSGRGARITFDISAGEDVFAMIGQASRRHGLQVTSLIMSRQDHRPVCVVHIKGSTVDKLLDELWSSGHQVLNVLQLDSVSTGHRL